MKISELITQLETIKAENGDIKIALSGRNKTKSFFRHPQMVVYTYDSLMFKFLEKDDHAVEVGEKFIWM
jgi:hypothetical protein